jgi:hypothetical protein
MRCREQSLAIAKEYDGFLNDVVIALRNGGRNELLADELVRCRTMLLENLAKTAEYEYQSILQRRALQFMERRCELTSEEVIATIEAHMLEMAFTAGT